MRVGILGGGRWGQALGRLVMAAGHDPLIAWREKKEKPPHILPSTNDPPSVSATCDLLIAATSAGELRHAIQLARPHAGNRVVVATRGLEPGTGKWLTDVVLEESDALRVGALAGPAPVEEILNGGLCAGVIASRYAEVRAMFTTAMHSTRYRVYESDDLAGVQLAGAMVPVLATLIGMASGLGGSGVGVHAMVVSRGIEEASRLSKALGGNAETLSGLAGIGDLVAAQGTAASPAFQAGLKLAKGDRTQGPRVVAETLLHRATAKGVEMPLLSAMVAVWAGLDPLEALQQLMSRKATKERVG
jgi:glycerol-3-phosphate dehydrogenase (NAD(P)+)